jgi:hypothetical protein
MKKKLDIPSSPRANRFEVRPPCGGPWTQNFYDPITEASLLVGQRVSRRDLLDAMVTGETLDAFERAVTVSERSAAQATERAATICPYRGLQIFREEDAAFFVGREAFCLRLLEFGKGLGGRRRTFRQQ